MRRYVATVAVLAMLPVMLPGKSKKWTCEKWGDYKFFRKAGPEFVKECLARGADPNFKKRGKIPVIVTAAETTRSVEIIDILIEAGADVTAPDRSYYNVTALHYAVSKSPEMTASLLLAGADPNARTKAGETPMHRAASSRNENASTGIALLVSAGADPNALDKYGETPLDGAYEWHKPHKPMPTIRTMRAVGGVTKKHKPKTKSGLGALVAGVTGAVIATGAGLNEEEALGVAQDAANTVLTGTPTLNATEAAVDRTRALQEAALRDAALVEATANATARAVSDELLNQRLMELGLNPDYFDDQHKIREILRKREEARR